MRRKTYPWNKWFEKSKFKLVQGKDYTCQTHGMIAQIRTAASSRKLYVTIDVDGTEITVTVVSQMEKTSAPKSKPKAATKTPSKKPPSKDKPTARPLKPSKPFRIPMPVNLPGRG